MRQESILTLPGVGAARAKAGAAAKPHGGA